MGIIHEASYEETELVFSRYLTLAPADRKRVARLIDLLSGNVRIADPEDPLPEVLKT